ncbi:MAG: RDD family protein [Candidatus Limnocylindrales bacterium]
MAEDDLSGGGPSGPSRNPPEPTPGSATSPGGADDSAEEAPQRLPPAQTLPPFQSFTSLSPQTIAGTGGQGDALGSGPTASDSPGLVPGIERGAYGPSTVPPVGPAGYPGPGFAPPDLPPSSGYRAPYGPPPYPPPYGSPPYGSPPYGSPQYPASSWPPPQPGSWGAPGYPPTGWGYQPGYAPAAYAPPGPGPGLLWGGIGERFGALLIDGVILVCSLFALGLLVTAIEGSGSSSRSGSPAITAISLIWWFLALIYHPACWWVFGSTPGQKALGLRVAQASNGQSLGIGAVLVRYLIFFIVTVIFPLGLISAVMASNDPFKRAWHDEVARSVVVKRLG